MRSNLFHMPITRLRFHPTLPTSSINIAFFLLERWDATDNCYVRDNYYLTAPHLYPHQKRRREHQHLQNCNQPQRIHTTATLWHPVLTITEEKIVTLVLVHLESSNLRCDEDLTCCVFL